MSYFIQYQNFYQEDGPAKLLIEMIEDQIDN